MKKFSFGAIALYALISTTSCQKIKDALPGGDCSCSINGSNFTAKDASGALSSKNDFSLDANASDGKNIQLVVSGASDTQTTYNVDSIYVEGLYYASQSATHASVGTSGTIELHLDGKTRAYGKFNFTCSDGTKVEAGEFDVHWQ